MGHLIPPDAYRPREQAPRVALEQHRSSRGFDRGMALGFFLGAIAVELLRLMVMP